MIHPPVLLRTYIPAACRWQSRSRWIPSERRLQRRHRQRTSESEPSRQKRQRLQWRHRRQSPQHRRLCRPYRGFLIFLRFRPIPCRYSSVRHRVGLCLLRLRTFRRRYRPVRLRFAGVPSPCRSERPVRCSVGSAMPGCGDRFRRRKRRHFGAQTEEPRFFVFVRQSVFREPGCVRSELR